jgi:nucleoside-diphosphate-sugar epimerase
LRTIAVLGSSGFLGRALCQTLESSDYEIFGFRSSNAVTNRISQNEYLILDFLKSPEFLTMKFDAIINLASRRSTRHVKYSDEEVHFFTYQVPSRFIERFCHNDTIIINSSSYIQNYHGIPGKSVDSYSDAKNRLSEFLESFSKLHGITVFDLYFFTIYGNGDKSQHLIPTVLRAARNGEHLSLSPGNQLINLIYIQDAIENILQIFQLQRQGVYSKYAVWEPHYLSLRNVISEVEKSIGLSLDCGWGELGYAGHEMMTPWHVPMPILPGFRALTPLSIGINTMWEDFG